MHYNTSFNRKGGFKLFNSKILGVLTALMMCVMLGGCGGSDSPNTKAETLKIGTIASLNAGEQQFNDYLKNLESQVTRNHLKLSANYTFYDNLTGMQLGLQSGEVDEISTYKCVADYLIVRQPGIEIKTDNVFDPPLKDNFCCAVKSDRSELLDALNNAIDAMKDDGTLEKLTKQFIADQNDGAEPDAVEMPKLEGAETIKVAVTGDLPPIDLITADGKPAGFNTAVLAEISKLINKNFELVSIESTARASALSSGAVDIVFWVRVPESDSIFPLNVDRPEGIDISHEYYKDEIVHVGMKK